MTYDVAIVEHSAKRLTGVGVRTSMATSAEDCPALWERFMTPVLAIAGPHAYDAYGLSTDFAEDMTFSYWAAVDAPIELLREPTWVALGTPTIPIRIEGLATIDIQAGQYAMVTVPSLSTLQNAYGFLYHAWPKAQTDYAIDFGVSCFEFYPAAWKEDDPLQLFVPVRKNG